MGFLAPVRAGITGAQGVQGIPGAVGPNPPYGTLAARPNVATVDERALYFATDDGSWYQRQGGAWVEVTPFATLAEVTAAIAAADAVQLVRKAADAAPINASVAYVQDADLRLTVGANTVYEVAAHVIYDSAQAADLNVGWTWTGGVAPSLRWTPTALAAAATTSTSSIQLGVFALTDAALCGGIGVGTTKTVVARLSGLLVTGASGGDINLRFAQAVSDATDTVVRAGSFLRATRA